MGATFVKVLKEKNFTVIDNGIFKDTGLSMKAKGLLTTMLSLPEDWNFSIEGLTQLFADGETAVRNALTELISNGYLTRKRVTDDKGRVVDWQYIIYEERQPVSQQPVVENTQLENLGQLSTNILRTNKLNTKETLSKDKVDSDESSPETPQENIQKTEVYSSRRKRLFDTDDTVASKPKKKGNLFERCVEEAKNRYHDELLTVVLEYLNYRIKSKQHGFGFQAWVNLLNKLDKLADFDQEKIKIVEQSLQMKWDTFAELRTWGKKTGCERFGETEDMRSGVPVGEVLDIQF